MNPPPTGATATAAASPAAARHHTDGDVRRDRDLRTDDELCLPHRLVRPESGIYVQAHRRPHDAFGTATPRNNMVSVANSNRRRRFAGTVYAVLSRGTMLDIIQYS